MTPLCGHVMDGVHVIVFCSTLDTLGRREVCKQLHLFTRDHILFIPDNPMFAVKSTALPTILTSGLTMVTKRFQFMGRLFQFRDIESKTPPPL